MVTVLLLVVLAGMGIGYTWWRVGNYLGEPIAQLDKPVDVMVEPGTSLTRMVYLLAEQKLLQYLIVTLILIRCLL